MKANFLSIQEPFAKYVQSEIWKDQTFSHVKPVEVRGILSDYQPVERPTDS